MKTSPPPLNNISPEIKFLGVEEYTPVTSEKLEPVCVIYRKALDFPPDYKGERPRFVYAACYYLNGRLDLFSLHETSDENLDLSNLSKYFQFWHPGLRFFELEPVEIPKPWGKEIWFTGIENRGISRISIRPVPAKEKGKPRADGTSNLLISFMQLFGNQFLTPSTPVLLKILSPRPDPRTGNLYYELHEKKQEVYVVSNIGSSNGAPGKMKYGISEKKKRQFSSEEKFKEAFLEALVRYEKIRAEVDEKLGLILEERNLDFQQAHDQGVYNTLKQSLEKSLLELEEQAKEEVESFVGWMDLGVGDVIAVETHVPHSLQHGVEVIEFQTPVYERSILSFDQKVLTQNHWDCEKAVNAMKLVAPKKQPLSKSNRFEGGGLTCLLVASFDDFEVFKIEFKGVHTLEPIEGHAIYYQLQGSSKVSFDTKHNQSTEDKDLFFSETSKAYFIPEVVDKITLESEHSVILLTCEMRG